MAPPHSTPDASKALLEAERLLSILEKQVPALASLESGLKPLIPPLRSATQALRQLTGRSRSPQPSLTEVQGVLRHVQLASSQLKGRGARGHSATVLKALDHVEALLTPLTKAPGHTAVNEPAPAPPVSAPLPAPTHEKPAAAPARPRPPSISGMKAAPTVASARTTSTEEPPPPQAPPAPSLRAVAGAPARTTSTEEAPTPQAPLPPTPRAVDRPPPARTASTEEPPLAQAPPAPALRAVDRPPPALASTGAASTRPVPPSVSRGAAATPRPPSGAAPAPARPSPAELPWSVESLVLASVERPPLQLVASQAPSSQESGEEPAAPPADDTARSLGLGPATPQAGRTHFVGGLLELHLEHLASAFATREAQLDSGEATGATLAVLEDGLLAHTDALRWLGPSVVPVLAERLAGAEDGATAFSLALPLLTLAGDDTSEAVERAARALVPEAAAGLVEALRFAPHPRLPQLLDAFSLPESPSYLRVPAMGLLAQHRLWNEARARAALAEDEPEVVAAAARAVLTTGQARLLDFLEALLARGLEAPADTQVLITAAVLGSSRALERARARLTEEAEPPTSLLGLLATCGDKVDEGLLWRRAQGKTPMALEALQALVWLGPAEAVPRVRALAEGESASEEAKEALQLLVGAEGSAPASGRVAQGSPWTVKVPLALLASPSASARQREWAFWELAARTGVHVPFDPRWPWARQREAARGWQTTVEGSPRRLPMGTWLYQGRLVMKGGST